MKPEPPQDAERRKSNRSPPYALFNLLVIIVAIIYGAYYQMYISKDATGKEETKDVPQNDDDLIKIPLFTADELKKYDGVSEYWSWTFHHKNNLNDDRIQKSIEKRSHTVNCIINTKISFLLRVLILSPVRNLINI